MGRRTIFPKIKKRSVNFIGHCEKGWIYGTDILGNKLLLKSGGSRNLRCTVHICIYFFFMLLRSRLKNAHDNSFLFFRIHGKTRDKTVIAESSSILIAETVTSRYVGCLSLFSDYFKTNIFVFWNLILSAQNKHQYHTVKFEAKHIWIPSDASVSLAADYIIRDAEGYKIYKWTNLSINYHSLNEWFSHVYHAISCNQPISHPLSSSALLIRA